MRLLVAAGPALLVGALGLLHPVFLTPETADRWQLAHYLLLPVFPLVAGSVWWLVRGDGGPLAWGARVLALAYAVLYSALDAIAGVGAPEQVRGASSRGEPAPPIGDLYAVGDQLGRVGVIALAVAVALAAAVVFVRTRSPLAPVGAVVAAAGCVLFYRHHIFPPRGVLGMVLIAAGLAAIAFVQDRRRA